HRHRMAPAVADRLDALRAEGRLVVRPGGPVDAVADRAGCRVREIAPGRFVALAFLRRGRQPHRSEPGPDQAAVTAGRRAAGAWSGASRPAASGPRRRRRRRAGRPGWSGRPAAAYRRPTAPRPTVGVDRGARDTP